LGEWGVGWWGVGYRMSCQESRKWRENGERGGAGYWGIRILGIIETEGEGVVRVAGIEK